MQNCKTQNIIITKDGFLLKMNKLDESHDSGSRKAGRVHFELRQYFYSVPKLRGYFKNVDIRINFEMSSNFLQKF